MYTAFYGLREKPFSLTPDPRFIFLAESHREAMAHLLYGLEEGAGFIVISGEVGTGKTTICRSLLTRLGSETEVAILFNPSQNAKELLQAISDEFDLPADGLSRRELLSQLNRFLLEKNRESRRVVLIVDEAQNLSPGTLEQIRLLSNLETTTSKLIQIILLGQPELDVKLDSDELRQLRQRVSVRWSLAPLPANDSALYVKHRLQIAAGAPRDIFTPAALREIHRRTRGIPRLINVLCDRVLLAGYADESHRIGPKLVIEAAKELPDAARPQRRRMLRAGASKQAPSAPAPRRMLLWAAAVGVLLAVSFGYGMTGGGKLAQRIVQQAPGPSYVVVEPLDASDGAALPEVASRAPDAGSAVDAGARDANVVEFTTEIGRVYDGRGVDGGVATVTVIAPVSPTAPPLQDEETWIGLPHEVSELVHPVGAPPGGLAEEDGEFLAALLARQDAAEGRLYALNSILDVFGSSGLDGLPAGDSEIDAAFAANDLSLIRFPETDFETLRRLNYPAFLTLRAADGQLHSVALLGLEDGIALLAGIGRSERLHVPISAVEARWTGDAAIAWRAFEDIPEMVTYGAEGSSVLWIQTSLARLGFLEPPGISGVYDVDTLGGVRAFQRGHRLEPDGVTGPMTQMLLYGALRDYAPPRLDEGEAG